MGNRRTEKDGKTVWVGETRETVDHPAHYGGDTPYEAIKVIEAWDLGFCLGNTLKYICRAGRKTDTPIETANPQLYAGVRLKDLQKAAWYLNREIENLKAKIDG